MYLNQQEQEDGTIKNEVQSMLILADLGKFEAQAFSPLNDNEDHLLNPIQHNYETG